MKHSLIPVFLLLLALPVAGQQIPFPQVPLTGNIGAQGIFPIYNHGTINISGNYTLTYPDMSAEVIRITGTLSTPATITAPQTFGFDFVVENATNQSLTFAGPTGTGVTIPAGQTMQVMSDGTNYVPVGGGGGSVVSPFRVPSQDGAQNLTITVPNAGGGNPTLTSSTGTIDISSLFVTDLAGTGSMLLQTDPSGNVGRLPPQPATYVLAGPTLENNPIQPHVVQQKICIQASNGPPVICSFDSPTQAGNLIVAMPMRYLPPESAPPFPGTASDNLGQTYQDMPQTYPLNPTFYKENSAAGVTTVTTTASNGNTMIILEVADIAPSLSYDADSYNVGQVPQLPGPPIEWLKVVTSNASDLILGYWTCPVNSTTQPTPSAPWTIGGYQAATSNGSSTGWVSTAVGTVGTYTPAVNTADCHAQPANYVIAFKASLVGSAGPVTARPMVASDLPRTPWSALTNPVPNYLTQLEMGLAANLFEFNVGATNSFVNDWGFGWIMDDISTVNPDCYTLGTQEKEQACRYVLDTSVGVPGLFPFQADACAGGNDSMCNGFHVDGTNGNIVLQANAGISMPNGGQIVSAGPITSDNGMFAPVYNVCTPTNPCTTPPTKAATPGPGGIGLFRRELPRTVGTAPRMTGGEPLSSFHLHDFSATTLPTDGQVPVFNASQGKYVPGSGGLNPPYTIRTLTNTYTFTAADFASCVTFTNAGTLSLQATLPSTVPPVGQCIIVVNYGTGNVQINTGGSTINGSAAASILPGITNSPYFSNSTTIVSTGTAYISERAFSSVPWEALVAGTISNRTLLVGAVAAISPVSGGVVNANQVNGGTIAPNLPVLASDNLGRIIAGTSGSGGINPPYSIRTLASPYTFTADDFLSCATFTTSPSAPANTSATMPATPPPVGGCVRIANLGTGGVSINPNGNTVNGGTVSTIILPGYSQSPYNTNTVMYISTGTGYITDRYLSAAPWASIQAGTLGGQALLVGAGSSLAPSGGGTINANQVNGAAVPPNLASVATNATGQFVAGSGGATLPWSSLTAATSDVSISNNNWRTVFGSNFAGDSSGGNAYTFQQNGTGAGTSYNEVYINAGSPNVSPLLATNSAGNGLRVGSTGSPNNSTIAAVGAAKFVGPLQLTGTGMTNLTSLGTDGTGNIIPGTGGGGGEVIAYDQTYQDLSMAGTVGPITLPGCTVVNNNCVAVTPAVDTTYRLLITVTQTAPGLNCTANGTIQFWIGFTEGYGGAVVANSPQPASNIGATTYASNMNMGNNANGTTNIYNVMPLTVRVKGGTSFTYRVQQTVVGSGCSPQPVFAARIILFGEPTK